jgi:hypothetical protein
VYSTCLFCTQPLGSNEAIETFPVGRRIAFDAARGRLWVVCRKCERWNLSPIEERWEAIEDCERRYRDTRTRVSTDQIGLARLPEGTELVRIGAPLRPEFAAWRYGDQFGRRRKRAILYTAGAATAFGAIVIGGALSGVVSGAILAQSGNWVNLWVNARTRVKLRTDDGRVIKLRNPDLLATRILPDTGTTPFSVSVGSGKRLEQFEGPEAERVASQILPGLNTMGGAKTTVQDAVRQIEDGGGPAPFLRSELERAASMPPKGRGRRTQGALAQLPKPTRLAIEMALHEERERRALEGELELLASAWQAAEEIAGISDDLLLPPGAREFIEAARSNQEPT